MLVVRRVVESDLDPLFDLIQQSELGLTTLAISRDKLQERIEGSLFAFQRKTEKPSGEPYVFVMEDLSTGTIVGTSTIYSKVGGFEPFYSYLVKKSIHESPELGIRKEIDVLHLSEEHDGPTEIGSLFLAPDYWGQGHGRLLSLSRFLFIAEFPNRFEREVIAEMRGVVDKAGHSPLWAALGSHFFQIDFPRAETLTSQSKKFIADLMPKHPIYIPLLPQEAQQVIGRVHPNTEPALAMLKKEGFVYRNVVDIFDGGPTVHCPADQIRAVRDSRQGNVIEIAPQVSSAEPLLVSNANLDFRCCLGAVHWEENGGAVVDELTALRLNLKQDDPIRVVPVKPPAKSPPSTP